MISGLFILLAARIRLSDFRHLTLSSLLFLAILIAAIRPISVWLSSLHSRLSWKEKLFLSAMAPRGVVAAAISSIFAMKLTRIGVPQSQLLTPLTFLVIVGTGAFYGLVTPPLAKKLGVARTNPQGVLFVGAHSWALEMAKALKDSGFKTLMIDTNWSHVHSARMAGVPGYYGSILSENILEEIDLSEIGHVLALTPNDEANSLALLHLADMFDRSMLFQLLPSGESPSDEDSFTPKHLRGRFLFQQGIDYHALNQLFAMGGLIKTIKLTDEFSFTAFQRLYGESTVPLFLINENGTLSVFTTDAPPEPRAGQTIMALVQSDQ